LRKKIAIEIFLLFLVVWLQTDFQRNNLRFSLFLICFVQVVLFIVKSKKLSIVAQQLDTIEMRV